MEKVSQNSCQDDCGINFLQVPDMVEDDDEDISISESPTVKTGTLNVKKSFILIIFLF